MIKVFFPIIGIWILVVVAIVIIAASSGATDEIAGNAAVAIAASANMDNQPGTLEMVQSFPAWKWAIPPVIGVVLTGMHLFRHRDELSNR